MYPKVAIGYFNETQEVDTPKIVNISLLYILTINLSHLKLMVET